MDHAWLSLLFALAVTELTHNAIEIWGIRQKVSWLTARLDGLEHSKWPINIDTKAKVALVHGAILIVLAGPVWLASELLILPPSTLIIGSATVLLASFIYTTISVDRYHTEISKVLKRFKRF